MNRSPRENLSPALRFFDLEREDPDVLLPEEEDRLLSGAPWKRFAVLGDSIAEGIGEQLPGYRPERWGLRLSNALRRQQPDLEYLNLGRRDLFASQVRESQLPAALEFGPDLAAVVCGGNDLLRKRFDDAAVEAEIESVVEALAARGATVVTYSMMDITKALPMPPEFGTELSARLGALSRCVERVSSRHGALLVDLASLPVASDRGIYSSDFKHANTRGQAVAASHTIRRLGTFLGNELPDEQRPARVKA